MYKSQENKAYVNSKKAGIGGGVHTGNVEPGFVQRPLKISSQAGMAVHHYSHT